MQLVERVGFCHGTMLLQSTHVIIQLCKYGYRVGVCVERCSTSFRGVSASYSRETINIKQSRQHFQSEAMGMSYFIQRFLIVEPFAHPTILFSILPVSPNKETRAIK